MKKHILTLILLTFVINSQAQSRRGLFGKDPIINNENWDKQKIHFGFFLGFNSYDFKINYNKTTPEIQVETAPGFNVGVIANARLNDFFNIRFEPGLNFSQRNLTYTNPLFTDSRDYQREIKSTYLNFPILLKFSAVRTGNVKPYLIGGFSMTMNLSSNSNSTDDNFKQVFRLKPVTNNYEIGFGVDLYLEYFKFSPSIRGVFSIEDELIRDNDPNSPWTGQVDNMKSRGIFINFAFH